MPTVVTSTIGATARDYSDNELWEAATDNDLVTADEQHDGEGYDDANFDASNTGFAGATTDATRYRRLFAASGEEFDPITNTGCYYSTSTGAPNRMVDCREDYGRFEHWGWENLTTGTNLNSTWDNHSSASNCRFVGTMFKNVTTGNTSGNAACWTTASAGHELLSCLAIGDAGASNLGACMGFTDGGNACEFYNCVAFGIDNGTTGGTGVGFSVTSATSSVINCASVDSEGNDFTFGGSTTHNNNASSDSTATGTGSVTSVVGTTIWNDPANDDFLPIAGEALENAGSTSPGSVDSAMDPANDHTATFEIGCYDQASNPGGAARRVVMIT